MIVILKRDDLLYERHQRAVESLELEHVKLSPEFIEQADLIVFVDGRAVKFLKHCQGFQSKASVNVLLSYITSITPITKERPPWRLKRFGHRREKV